MKPGRELDVKIARLLGWDILEAYSGIDAPNGYPPGSTGFVVNRQIPHFSTDDEKAFQVFLWLSEKLPQRVLIGGSIQPAVIVLDKPDTFKNSYTAKGETYAHAICLAAVRWAKRKPAH